MSNIADLEIAKFSSNGYAVTMVDSFHELAHQGKVFFYKTVLELSGADGETVYLMFKTADTAVEVAGRLMVYGSLEFDVEMYEDGTVSDDGSQLTVFNSDRTSSTTAETTLWSGPTVSDAGTLLWKTKTGASKSSTALNAGMGSYEIIAKKNSIYLFKLVKQSASAGFIDIDFFWSENNN